MATDTSTDARAAGGGSHFVQATHNMLFTLDPAKWRMDLAKTAAGDITHYQEAEGDGQRQVLKDFCAKNNRGLYHPQGTGNPISWNRTMFVAIRKEAFLIEVHKKHPTADFNPARDITARGLLHPVTGKKVLAINVHPVAGATNPNPDPDPPGSPGLSVWKNWAIGNYMLDLVSFTAAQMSREYYDVILLAGDYNGDLLEQRGDEWYYPSRILPSLYNKPQKMGGLDHLQATHTADVGPVRDWTLNGNSDHPLCFQEWAYKVVVDYPGK